MELGGRTGPRRSPLGAALSKQTLVNYMVYYITLYRRITPPLTTASLLGLWADFLQMYSKLRPSVYTAPTVSLSSPIILSIFRPNPAVSAVSESGARWLNEGPGRFYNHREGPYYDLLLIESAY